MKRTDGRTKRSRAAVAGLFLLVALASAGCSGNALMNPQVDQTATTSGNADAAGNNLRPAGSGPQQAGNNVRP